MLKKNSMAQTVQPGLALGVLVGALLCAACAGGLKVYDEPPPGYGSDENPTTIELDECPTLCAEALAGLSNVSSVLGCTLECGVDISADYAGTAVIVTPLFGVGGSLIVDGGGHCELVQDCPEQDNCVIGYEVCLDAATTSAEIEYCGDEFFECSSVYNGCDDAHDSCLEGAATILDACLAADDPDFEQCQEVFEAAATNCGCLYTACLDRSDASECEGQAQAMASVTSLGPLRWQVTRAFVDRQMARLTVGLDNEVMAVPLRGPTGRLIGVELPVISEQDTLYSIGLRSGDVVVSIGGTSPFEFDRRAYQRLYGQEQVRLVIRRDGKLRTMTYELR